MSRKREIEIVAGANPPSADAPHVWHQGASHWFTLTSLFFVVMTPVIYLAGRAYHDGWYAALNLNQGMFPLDTAGMLIEGAIAFGSGFGKLSTACIGLALHHWLVLLIVTLGGGLIWAAIASLSKRLDEDRATRKKADSAKETGKHWLFKVAIPRMLLLALAVSVFYEFVFAMTLGFALLTQPFVVLGKDEAKAAAAKGFEKSPMVTVRSPKGDVQRREIGCGPQFCALWGDGHASYAPVSAIS